jgi:hypothetical protein
MTAVSQRVSNFLGGISQQADEKLFAGQVKDALNCYPDTTLGMIKRPGGKYLGTLANATPLTSDNNFWFSVYRSETQRYIADIDSAGNVRVWDQLTGAQKTVTYSAGKEAAIKAYLATTETGKPWVYTNLKTLTINDFTYLLNTKKVVEARPKPAFTKNLQATITVIGVYFATEYKVTIGGTPYTFKTRTDYVTGDPPPEVPPLKLSEVVQGISGAITGGFKTKEIIDNTIYLTFDSATSVSAEAGTDGKALRVFQDSVDTFNRLPEQAKHGQVVKVANTAADKDDFYLKFVADNGTSGVGTWEETRAPDVSPGLKYETMPMALIRNPDDTFKVIILDSSETVNTLPLVWEDRLVGDEESNTHPSFVDNTIQDLFLFNNRLGFLTEDNVSMSQAGDYYNFYHKTATSQVISDPIDISCSSIRPAVLHAVMPIPQGLLLFSRSQQFLMEAENGAWTPATTTIRTLSNYECDPFLTPADLGSTVMFISKNQNWSRAFEIFTRGQRESPTVTEATKQVPEWMPNTITQSLGNAQNGLWVGTNKDSNTAYLFRYYEEGEERKLAAWVRWTLFGNIIHTSIQNDVLYALVSNVKGYTMVAYPLVLSHTSGGLVNSLGNVVDPYIDSWQEVSTGVQLVNRLTKVYIPAIYDTTKKMDYVVGLSKDPTQPKYCGLSNTITVKSDTGGNYFEIPGDVTNNHIYIGYTFGMELVLPRYMYSNGDLGYDFTGYTTTARMQFYTGLGGAVYFNIKDSTRKDWTDISGIRVADVYVADTSPFRDHYIYKVPIYQRPDNYTMKVISDNPFPVSLVAMQWEGQYSAGFYRRS